MGHRLARSDNPDAVFVFSVGINMDDDKNYDRSDQADGVPALLAVFNPVGNDDVKRIVPDPGG